MTVDIERDLSRRRLLAVGSAAGAGVLLAACTGNDKTDQQRQPDRRRQRRRQHRRPGKAIKIGFSAPAADHGWIAAITANADGAGQASTAT